MTSVLNVAGVLDQGLGPEHRSVLRAAAASVRTIGTRVYLVGGSVRDLLLGLSCHDLDLVVEGDGPALAAALAERLQGQVSAHSPFGTAQVKVLGLTVDVATARKERYPYPGALPVVTGGTLLEDLQRRDFSVHAMACSLMPDSWGRLIDPCDGRRDLGARVLRVLHEQSFVDDPTRMVRAVRYGGRLRFSLEKRTEQLILRDRPGLSAISGARRWKELRRVLEEQQPERALLWADRLGLLPALHPVLGADPWLAAACIRARQAGDALVPGPVYFCLLVYRLLPADLAALLGDLQPPASFAKPARDLSRLSAATALLEQHRSRPSEAVRVLEDYSLYAVWALRAAVADEDLRDLLDNHLSQWHSLKPRLTGRRLMELGVPEGPELGRCLESLRAARLDGLTRSIEDEVALVHRWRTGHVGL